MKENELSFKKRIKSALSPYVPPVVWEMYTRHRLRGRDIQVSKREFLLPQKNIDELFPGIDKSTVELPGAAALIDEMQTLPTKELLVLAALMRKLQPKRAFEFGTYTGLSTAVMAMNAASAEIFTLDLDPATRETHEHGAGVGGFAPFDLGGHFHNKEFSSRVHQLFANSVKFNFKEYERSMDFVFVDADHSYKFASHDTKRAFEMIHPGGVILWDDYIWTMEFPECEGVARTLHEHMKEKRIYRISDTRLAIYLHE